jgi:hypothetical protein
MRKKWYSRIETFALRYLSARPNLYLSATEILTQYLKCSNEFKGLLSTNRVAKVLANLRKNKILKCKKKKNRLLYAVSF